MSLKKAFFALSKPHAQIGETERLHAKSDAQLAQMGLKREDIVRHVYGAHLYM